MQWVIQVFGFYDFVEFGWVEVFDEVFQVVFFVVYLVVVVVVCFDDGVVYFDYFIGLDEYVQLFGEVRDCVQVIVYLYVEFNFVIDFMGQKIDVVDEVNVFEFGGGGDVDFEFVWQVFEVVVVVEGVFYCGGEWVYVDFFVGVEVGQW